MLAIGAGMVVWFVTQRMIGARNLAAGALYDHLHVVTAGANAWLNHHTRTANAILIASSLCVDAVTLFVLVSAVIGPSFTPFWGLLGLFMLRQISQATVALPPPPGIIWRDPGAPSLFVTYSVGNDFFFSGHTALAVYGAIQLLRVAYRARIRAGFIMIAPCADLCTARRSRATNRTDSARRLLQAYVCRLDGLGPARGFFGHVAAQFVGRAG
ncbi:MAG: hypothetical protein K8S22_17375 [Betaproteobacteria bacterium]|nr:hypothetical protein [Betaproteobacteria bacterium]